MTVLDITRGDDEEFDLALKEDDGSPYSIASAYLYFSVKQFRSDEEPLIFKTIGDGIEVVDEVGGLVRLDISAADTVSDYFPGTRKGLLWDLSVVTGGGKTKTLDKGTLNVHADVTRN